LICPTCGKRNPPGAAACSRCGRWLATNRMMGVTYHRSDLRRGSGPGAVAIGAALIAGLLFVGGAIYVSLLGGLQGNNGPGTSTIGAIDTPISSLPIFVQPTPTPTPSPTPTPTLPWYLTPSPSFSFGPPSLSPTPGIAAPTANFRGVIQNDGKTVAWTDKSTGDITSWLWDFGDGNGSTQQNPTYTYQSLGDYTVTLTVSGPGGSNSKSKVLHLIAAPTAVLSCNATGLTVKCDASSSTGQIDNYAWDWGDGSTDSGAKKKHPSHPYNTNAEKTYTITLTVSNSGGENSAHQDVTVTPPPSPTPTPMPTSSASPTTGPSPSVANALFWDSRIAFVVG
jgi:PKD repeat protein